jgi:hypothetical protein
MSGVNLDGREIRKASPVTEINSVFALRDSWDRIGNAERESV